MADETVEKRVLLGHYDAVSYDFSLLTDDDLFLFNEGSHFRLYEKLGAHPATVNGVNGTYFAVWAPNANRVTVIGDFNHWNREKHYLSPRGSSGIWEGFIPGIGKGACYKYYISSQYHAFEAEKADPFGFYTEEPPKTGSVVWEPEYRWGDEEWLQYRRGIKPENSPITIYEVHIGSWMRLPEEGNRPLTYRELAVKLAEYVKEQGFTHVQFLPIMEHPFYGSWGYQVTGFFSPTSRYGTPDDFMFLVDHLHRNGIGAILDWVPSHFPTDGYALSYFDGTHLYEHEDDRMGLHPDWNSYIFNYGRCEIRSFILSSALFWLDRFHVDGLRVDAVASMLYLDYSRKEGEWIPNEYGGKENLDAISLLRRFNEEAYRSFPGIQTIAEESTAWPMVSRPTYIGGLGFGMKWDMGWMHDTLKYFAVDPLFRKYHQNELTFRMLYAFMENFVLSLSHDEVVHGKRSLIGKMPGDEWRQFANLRLLLAYMYAQPGKKLLFMGGEFGQWNEWYHEAGLDWHLLAKPLHAGMLTWVRDLNRVYRAERALHQKDFDSRGFEWIDCNDSDNSVLTFLRKGSSPADTMVVAFNFTPVPRNDYRVGAPYGGLWREVLNSDAALYGGSGLGNMGAVEAPADPCHMRPFSLHLVLPPLSAVFLKWEGMGE
ncbi:MAG: 1,4-alpha-glucan branching protein GlgB [Pseudomonadota bacterium]